MSEIHHHGCDWPPAADARHVKGLWCFITSVSPSMSCGPLPPWPQPQQTQELLTFTLNLTITLFLTKHTMLLLWGFSHVMCVFIRNVSCLYQDGLLVLQYGSMTIRYESKLLRYNPSKDMNRIDFISIESTLNFYFLVKIKWNNVTLSCRHNMYGQIQTTCSFWLIHIDELTHQNI